MQIDFKGNELKVQEDLLTTEDGGTIPVTLFARRDPDHPEEVYYEVEIDGVNWLTCDTPHHGVILYSLLKDHVKEYMRYFTEGGSEG